METIKVAKVPCQQPPVCAYLATHLVWFADANRPILMCEACAGIAKNMAQLTGVSLDIEEIVD